MRVSLNPLDYTTAQFITQGSLDPTSKNIRLLLPKQEFPGIVEEIARSLAMLRLKRIATPTDGWSIVTS